MISFETISLLGVLFNEKHSHGMGFGEICGFFKGETFEDELPHNSMQLPIRTTDG